MSLLTENQRHAWLSDLPQQGLVIAPVVLDAMFPSLAMPSEWSYRRLRDAYNAFAARRAASSRPLTVGEQADWLNAVLDDFLGHGKAQWRKGNDIPPQFTFVSPLGERVRPNRMLFRTAGADQPALAVFVDETARLGMGRGRVGAGRLIAWCRAKDMPLALLTNGSQFRLYYVGLDHDAWLEWEADDWFADAATRAPLRGFLTLLGPEAVNRDGAFPLRDAALQSRTQQSELSAALGEQVREAIEMLLHCVNVAKQRDPSLLDAVRTDLEPRQVRSALYQAAVRMMMRLVVVLFAEARELLPRNEEWYQRSYGVEGLFATLDRAMRARDDLTQQRGAWARLLALCRLIHVGSAHPAMTLPVYGGDLFAPGDAASPDPLRRALAVLEDPRVAVSDRVVYDVLKLLKKTTMRVKQGRASHSVVGAVDFTELRTEYIGIIYEGLLDYEVREAEDRVVFLNIGNVPALPLARLEAMDDRTLINLFRELEKEAKGKPAGNAGDDAARLDNDDEEEDPAEEAGADADDHAQNDHATTEWPLAGRDGEHALDDPDMAAALAWARRAVVVTGRVKKPRGRSGVEAGDFARRVADEARRLIARVVSVGSYYLVRESGMRKGSGTFYTKPALAVPTAIRTLEPLAYHMQPDGTRGLPRPPAEILALKVVDPACGSASFLVAALHFLTDALWESLQAHNEQVNPQTGERAAALYIQPKPGKEAVLEIPGIARYTIDEYADSEAFAKKARARLGRVIVERCLYGVDLDPLAVELARLALWVETMDRDLPFEFLDHKLKVGNSLVGAWLDTFAEYPLAAWLREGGDKTHPTSVHHAPGAWTKAIKDKLEQAKKEQRDLLKGEVAPRLLGEIDDQELARLLADFRGALEAVHGMAQDTAEAVARQKAAYQALITSEAYQNVKKLMNLWCALWFWPTDMIEYAPTPFQWLGFGMHIDTQIATHVDAEMHFFHWELEFPDVFFEPGSGFHAVLGNPPWDTIQPDTREYFVRLDPIYRTYNKQPALERQRELFRLRPQDEIDWLSYNARFKALANWMANVGHPWGDAADSGEKITLARGNENIALHDAWRKKRVKHRTLACADHRHPFRHQGEGKPVTYKLFAEMAHALLREGGRLGMILPSALGSDNGSRDLRDLFLDHCRWEWDFVWMNTKKIFDIDGRYKFGAIIVQRGGQTEAITAAFSRTDPREWERVTPQSEGVVHLSCQTIQRLSPASRALVEPGTARDLELLEKLYDPARAILLGSDAAEGWHVTYRQGDFNMTSDSALFHPRPWWEERGFRPDGYGRWVNDAGEMALPLYQGRMLSHFDFSEKGWVSGSGSRTVWRNIDPAEKVMAPQFLMDAKVYGAHVEARGTRIGMLDIRRATDTRTMYTSLIPPFPCGHTLPILDQPIDYGFDLINLTTIFNSFVYDFVMRQRLGGAHITKFVLDETPLLLPSLVARYPLAQWAARLTLIHPLWAREWLEVRRQFPEFGARPWRAWWATTRDERLRLRCMIDAVVAHAWGLTEDDFAWLLRDDPSDPKGFWRVDKDLPVEQRQTTLTLQAFRHLCAVGVERFCREEWWPRAAPGAEPPGSEWRTPSGAGAWTAEEIAAGWQECEAHAKILAATDPLRRVTAAGATAEQAEGAAQSLGGAKPEQSALPGMEARARQMRLGESEE